MRRTGGVGLTGGGHDLVPGGAEGGGQDGTDATSADDADPETGVRQLAVWRTFRSSPSDHPSIGPVWVPDGSAAAGDASANWPAPSRRERPTARVKVTLGSPLGRRVIGVVDDEARGGQPGVGHVVDDVRTPGRRHLGGPPRAPGRRGGR